MRTEYAARAYHRGNWWVIDVRAYGVHIGDLTAANRDDVEAVVVEYLRRRYDRPKNPQVQVTFPDLDHIETALSELVENDAEGTDKP